MNRMEFHLIQNQKQNCHHDHIPFNLKGNGNIVFSVKGTTLAFNSPRGIRISRQSCLPNSGHPLKPLGTMVHSMVSRSLRRALYWAPALASRTAAACLSSTACNNMSSFQRWFWHGSVLNVCIYWQRNRTEYVTMWETEIFSKSYQMKSIWDSIYYFPIVFQFWILILPDTVTS